MIKISASILLLMLTTMCGCIKVEPDDIVDTSGFNCASGNCYSVSDNASYSTLSACQAACISGGGGGGGGTPRPKGRFVVTVYRPPSGSCQSNPNIYPNSAFNGTLYANQYNAQGAATNFETMIRYNAPAYTNPNSSWTYTSLADQSRLIWELYPCASSWPTSCTLTGESFIDYEGQTKSVTIRW